MNLKLSALGAIAVALGAVAGCHNNDNTNSNNSTPPPQATGQSLDTAQVLVIAQQPSELAYPIMVNGGAVTISDTSDTSQPIAVNTH